MKVKKIIINVSLILMLTLSNVALCKVVIPLDNPNISYDGVFYPDISSSKVVFNRHLASMKDNWESGIAGEWINQWVITQTGIRIRFKTASPTIEVSFVQRTDGGTIGVNPTNGFAVFVDGVNTEIFSSLSFTIKNPTPDIAKTFEISLPNLWSVDFTELSLVDGYTLDALATLNKPVYVSIGNSITHGTGQYVSSAKTYPFLLAKEKGWNLYNLAVAGARLGWAMALNTKGKKIDVITVLIGFNDWKYSTTPLSTHEIMYGRLIDSLRAYHPIAQIFCITPLVTKETVHNAPYNIQEFRNMVTKVVVNKQSKDTKLCLISGPSISDTSMLAKDNIHLSVLGAKKLSDNLLKKTTECGTNILSMTQIENMSKLGTLFCKASGEFTFVSTETGIHQMILISNSGVVLEEQYVDCIKENQTIFNFKKDDFRQTIFFIKIIKNKKVRTYKVFN